MSGEIIRLAKVRRERDATALSVGEEAARGKPPLGKFGCKSVERVTIRPVTVRVLRPRGDDGPAAA